MSEPSPCPSFEQLSDYAEDRLGGDAEADLLDHLKLCVDCRQAITTLGAAERLPILESEFPTEHHESTRSMEQGFDDQPDTPAVEPADHEGASGECAFRRLGKYEILDLIGRGGMGVVFRARDTELHRTVAIKVLTQELAARPTARRRFLREARAAAAINHPNIVTIHDIGHHEDVPFIVFEYIKGPSLREHIRANKLLKPEDVIRLSVQVAIGLAAAHGQGVIHRDIKPANVMLDESTARVKIMDFGLARAATDNVELTSREIAVGTPAYMSPEQVVGKKLDARSDLFGLGCVMYAMLQGHSPFHGTTSLDSAHRVCDHHPAPLHEQDPRVPLALADVISRLLEKDVSKRYSSALEVGEILNRQLAVINQSLSSELSETLQRLPRPVRPGRRQLARLAVPAVLVLLAATAFFAWPYLQQEVPPLAGTLPETDSALVQVDADAMVVTVAQQDAANFRSIQEAVARLRPGGTVEILDDGLYQEAVMIDRLPHISIVSDRHATLADPAGTYTVLGIGHSPGTRIQGLQIQTHSEQHAIVFAGDCSGVTVEDVRCQSSSRWCQVYLPAGVHGGPETPLTIRNSTFTATSLGVCASGTVENPVGHVQILDNRFEGPGSQLQMNGAVHDVIVRENIFRNGGLHFNLGMLESHDLTIENNTFFADSKQPEMPVWLILGASLPELANVRLSRNAILGDLGCTTDTTLSWIAEGWDFQDNRWQLGERMSKEVAELFAKVIDNPGLSSTDPKKTDFLRPMEGSELTWRNADGTWDFAGAVAPRHLVNQQPEDNNHD